MNKAAIKNEIIRLEEKLRLLRIEYSNASDSMKKYLAVGGKLLKERKEKLEKELSNDEQLTI